MKIEISEAFPEHFRPAYPEEFELFSHFETTAGIPSPLFAITTWKENGLPNVCFHAWSCFHGDRTAFFAVMGNLYQHTHTYANILRDGCFALNFLPVACYDRLVETIRRNGMDEDEFEAGGFALEEARTIHAPLIAEAFLSLECTLTGGQRPHRRGTERHGDGTGAACVGRGSLCGGGYDRRYGKDGFMLLVPAPQNLRTGAPGQSGIATVHIERLD